MGRLKLKRTALHQPERVRIGNSYITDNVAGEIASMGIHDIWRLVSDETGVQFKE